jgi:lipopolysaccharide/colanic/teichoic acid biosynthesis glycosyltransferase
MLDVASSLVPSSRGADSRTISLSPPPELGTIQQIASLNDQRSGLSYVGKRILDVVLAGYASLVLAPLMLLIAVLIRLDSRGPVLFRQQRLGRDGTVFLMWKFRTMVIDAEDRLPELETANEVSGGALFKIRRDPRITRIGRFLRRTSLDELPQLFNILQGTMSVVGPRPLPLRDCEKLRKLDAVRFEKRLTVLPGLTGPWQVSGRSDQESSRLLDLDLEYVERWSLLWDLRLILQTVVVVFTQRGAY